MKKLVNPLSPGDVIRTHPERGFWGCAIVLTARDSTPEFHPMCHIATTTLIRPRKFAWKNIESSVFEIAKFTPEVRVAPNEYYQASEARTCIGIYSIKNAKNVDLIGRVDPKEVYPHPLTFKVGDGTSGSFPLCGPVADDLGYEAVFVWRSIHDADRLELENRENTEWFEAYEEQRLAEAKQARKTRAASNYAIKGTSV